MSARKIVVFTTSAIVRPAASRTAVRFRSARSACASTPPPTSSPVVGSSPICPEQKTNPSTAIAWLYGPSAAGAPVDETACRDMPPPSVRRASGGRLRVGRFRRGLGAAGRDRGRRDEGWLRRGDVAALHCREHDRGRLLRGRERRIEDPE